MEPTSYPSVSRPRPLNPSQRYSWRTIFLFTAGLAVLGLSLYCFVLSLNRPFLGVDLVRQGNDYVVKELDPYGLASRAGVEAGDVVIAVDGKPPQQVANLRRYSRSGLVHQIEVVDKEGNKKLVTTEGGSVSRETILQNSSLLLVGLAFWAVSFYVYSRRWQTRAATMLYLLSLAFFLSLAMSTTLGKGIPGVMEAQVAAGLLVAPLFLHFFLVFPQEKLMFLTQSRLVYLIYLPAVVLLLVYALGGWGDQIYYGWLRSLILLHLALGLVLGFLSLLHTFVTAKIGKTRRQVKVILLGAAFTILPFLFLSVIPDALGGRALVIPQLSILSAVAFPLTLGYAVVKYRLLDVDFYISRALVYGQLTLLLVAGYILSILVLSRIMGLTSELAGVIAIALFSTLIALFFAPARERLQKTIDRLVYRDRYEYRETVQQLSTGITSFKDIDSLAQFIVETPLRIMGLRGACLLLHDRAGNLIVAKASGFFAEDEGSRQEALKWAHRLDPKSSSPQFVPQESPVDVLVSLKAGGRVLGILCLAPKVSRAEFSQEDFSLLSTFSYQAATCVENALLLEKERRHIQEIERAYGQLQERTLSLEQSQKELEDAYLDIAKTMILALDARDHYTGGHSERVSFLARRVAVSLKLTPQEVRRVDIASRFHDMGKLGISDSILLKPGSLSLQEWAQIETHPSRSVEILRFLGFLRETLPIIEAHHERYDGKGYPYGLKRDEIPLGARILAVADAYDAMISDRPYRPALSTDQAIAILKDGAGTAWDPQVVDTFLRAFEPYHH